MASPGTGALKIYLTIYGLMTANLTLTNPWLPLNCVSRNEVAAIQGPESSILLFIVLSISLQKLSIICSITSLRKYRQLIPMLIFQTHIGDNISPITMLIRVYVQIWKCSIHNSWILFKSSYTAAGCEAYGWKTELVASWILLSGCDFHAGHWQ